MKNKSIIISAILILIVAILSLCSCSRGKDIVGVTTKDNAVYMNIKNGDEFVSGSGQITVCENEYLHLGYDISSGSFDIAMHGGDGDLSVFRDVDMANLPAPDYAVDGVFGISAVSGKGSLDYEVAPGNYTVFFTIHDTVGTATVTAESK